MGRPCKARFSCSHSPDRPRPAVYFGRGEINDADGSASEALHRDFDERLPDLPDWDADNDLSVDEIIHPIGNDLGFRFESAGCHPGDP